MALVFGQPPDHRLLPEEIAAWRSIPTAIISDERNRAGTPDGGLRRLSEGGAMVGIALTVRTMAADNLALHHAVARAPEGAVLMVDAGGYDRNAVWGGILHKAAERRRVAGVVIDGFVRDIAELRVSPSAVYARGVTPAGPHKGWGGEINVPIQIGGATVEPGDIVIGDEDGVAIVPWPARSSLLEACRTRIRAEAAILAAIAEGKTTVELFGL